MEMTGRPEDGLGWMAARETFWATPENALQSHVWWHKSLFHLELGQLDAALTLYDGPLLRTMRPVGTRLTDPAALLWRLDTLGYDVGKRWQDLLSIWEGHADGKCLVFTDLHAAMVELRSGNEALGRSAPGLDAGNSCERRRVRTDLSRRRHPAGRRLHGLPQMRLRQGG
jgi:hypothetical protein